RKAVELDGRRLGGRLKKATPLGLKATPALPYLVQHLRLLANLDGNSPDAGDAELGVKDKLAVERFEGFASAVSCYLHGRPESLALGPGRHLPHLPRTTAVGAEIDPSSVS